ncbi:hypothetical protein ABW20_dc0105386 [Dactylellina cionopaga]|nr:hypothetical protein ABW20_dc0105386 [Dactylellina cionopaga]
MSPILSSCAQPTYIERGTNSHSYGSPVSTPSVADGWSIGSPALSITSIDPCSPSLRFKDRSHGDRSDNADSTAGGEEAREDQAADLRRKASNYLQYVESLSQAYESQLKSLAAFFKAHDSTLGQAKVEQYTDDPSVTIIEVTRDGSRHLVGIDDVEMLIEYFCEQEESEQDSSQPSACNEVVSRVFLLDRITPDLVGILGARLSIEPHEPIAAQQGLCEGCSIHLDYNHVGIEPATVLIMTNVANENPSLSKSLRTSFIEHLMAGTGAGETQIWNNTTPTLTFDLIKGTLHHLATALAAIPEHTNKQISHLTINLFNDDTDKIRDSIHRETAVISSLSKSLQNSLVAFGQAQQGTTEADSGRLADAIKPLICAFQDQSERIQQWLDELDAAVVDNQKKRETQLRRLKIVLPVCSISLAIGVVVVFVTRFRENF